MKRTLILIILLLLAACTRDNGESVETLSVHPEDFVISLYAAGELRAVESTAIMPPAGSRTPRTVAWLAPNFGAVKKGQVVARFDVSDAERGALESGIELSKVDLQLGVKERELERLLQQLGGELEIIDIEKSMAEKFAIEDNLAYSRFEIIDARLDKRLLEYRAGHLEEKKETYGDRQSAEIAVLDAQRATQLAESDKHQRLLALSEVRAPHDGFFVYEKNWWGQDIEVGTTVFPGNRIASIPNLEKMEAVLLVPETEAVGITPGQAVDLTLDAYPDRPLTATVSGVSAAAAPIEQDNPVKYFAVIAALDQADPGWIKPGAQLRAEIHINRIENTLAIPNQAFFQDSSGDWVVVRNGSGFERRPVTLGMRGPNRSQVVGGLAPGDAVALYPPAGFSP